MARVSVFRTVAFMLLLAIVSTANAKPGPQRWLVSAKTAAISPSGKYVVLGYSGLPRKFGFHFRVWDMEKGELVATLKNHDDSAAFCSFLASDERILTVSKDGNAILHKLSVKGAMVTVEPVKDFWVHDAGVVKCAISANGRYLISVGAEPGLETHATKVWDLEKVEIARVLDDRIPFRFSNVAHLAISPDGSFALTWAVRVPDATGKEADIYLWDVKKNKLLRTFQGTEGWVSPLAFSGDGKEFVLVKRTERPNGVCEVSLWDAKSLTVTKTFKSANKEIGLPSLRNVSGQPIWLGWAERDPPPAVASWDFSMAKEPKIMRLDNGRIVDVFGQKRRPNVFARAISADGKYALLTSDSNGGTYESGSTSMQIHVWNLASGKLHSNWTDPTPSTPK